MPRLAQTVVGLRVDPSRRHPMIWTRAARVEVEFEVERIEIFGRRKPIRRRPDAGFVFGHVRSLPKSRRRPCERRLSDLFRSLTDHDIVAARLRVALQRPPNRVGAESLDNAIKLSVGVLTATMQAGETKRGRRSPAAHAPPA